ncbi:hypothetical protein BELL_0411g00150 [Botrytis elliptica]|uniref:Uncharacterized protein n=1 Tax=Botrytis elliptica TaxID=278938 RepID=A0A4Z1JUH9_9HELO|nr:hypothetical protein BELL_0411g00150 [Botrytis elliptica]
MCGECLGGPLRLPGTESASRWALLGQAPAKIVQKKAGVATEKAGANTRTEYANVQRGVWELALVTNAMRSAYPRVLAQHKSVRRGL